MFIIPKQRTGTSFIDVECVVCLMRYMYTVIGVKSETPFAFTYVATTPTVVDVALLLQISSALQDHKENVSEHA